MKAKKIKLWSTTKADKVMNKDFLDNQYRFSKSESCSFRCSAILRSKRKPPRLKDGQALKKKLWTIFSQFIRLRDGGKCISCGKIKFWRQMDAGHYIPRTAGLSIYFDERNVNCQCTYCNRWMHGNLSSYAIALRKKYGGTILEELDELRKKQLQINQIEYQNMIKEYKQKVAQLIKEL